MALQRVLLLSKGLSPASIASLSRDWAKWDSANSNSNVLFLSPQAYAIQYRNWIQQLLAWLGAGQPELVVKWWERELKKKVIPAEVIVPPLPPCLLAQASHLTGGAPAASSASGGGAEGPAYGDGAEGPP